jgi:hypothetical protein
MSEPARDHNDARASGPPPMSAYDWIGFVLSRRHRAYIQLRNSHYLYGGFNFDAVGRFRGEGDFVVSLRIAGNATVVDRDTFIRHQALLPEKREKFALHVLAHIKMRMTALRYFCPYHPRSTQGPAWPEFYRHVMDQDGVWRCERDPSLVDLARDVRNTFQPMYGASLTLLLLTPEPVSGQIAEENFAMIKPDVLARILADPEYRSYETAKAVAMARRSDALLADLDQRTYGSQAQPLSISVQRIRSKELAVIRWKVGNWAGWSNPRVVGMRYQKHVPVAVGDGTPDNPSQPIVARSDQSSGFVEVHIKATQTAYFGFWLEGHRLVVGGLFSPSRYDNYCAKEPISFAVYMPDETHQMALEEFTILQEDRQNACLFARSDEDTSARLPAVGQGGAAGVEVEKRTMSLVHIRRNLPR